MSSTIIVPGQTGDVSDGYHTFNELYEHRHVLFINVALAHKDLAFKTWKNLDKETWDGWFILGLNTAHGQISYHLPARYWDAVAVREIEYNVCYDGHVARDVILRLLKMAAVIE